MAIALVGTPASAYNNASASSLASSAKSTTTGNTLIACIGLTTGTTAVSSVTDTALNTYTLCTGAKSNNVSGGNLEIWVADNITGNASNVTTANFGGAVTSRSIVVLEYSGTLSSGSFETGTGKIGNVAGGTTVTSASFSPASAGNLNVACSSTNAAAAAAWTAGSGYTSQATNTAASPIRLAEDKQSAASGAQTAAATYGNSLNMTIAVASFQPASGGGATVTYPELERGTRGVERGVV